MAIHWNERHPVLELDSDPWADRDRHSLPQRVFVEARAIENETRNLDETFRVCGEVLQPLGKFSRADYQFREAEALLSLREKFFGDRIVAIKLFILLVAVVACLLYAAGIFGPVEMPLSTFIILVISTFFIVAAVRGYV